MQLLANFGVGIIAGLVTAALVLAFRGWWLAALRPWYEERVYKDSRIEGIWYAYTLGEGGAEVEELRWEIQQIAHNVTGTIVCLNGQDKGRTYAANGTFKNLILTATYYSIDRQTLDRGTMALMLTNNGQSLKGHCAYYSAAGHRIDDSSYECERTRRVSA